QKATVRGSAIATLECLANATGLDPLINSFATSLATDNPLLRKDLLSWLSERLKEGEEKGKKSSPDFKPLVVPLLSCLADRNGDVRKAAQACLGPVVNNAGYDFVVTKCGDLKGAVKQSIMPMIEAVRPVGGTGAQNKKPGQKPRPGAAKREPSPEEDDEEPEPLPLPSLRRPTDNPVGATGIQGKENKKPSLKYRFGAPMSKRDPSPEDSEVPESLPLPSLPGLRRPTVNNHENSVEHLIEKIASPDPQQSIEGLKEVDKELNGSPNKVFGHVDKLVNALTLQIRSSYPLIEPQKNTIIRLCKHLVNALVLLFSNKDLASTVSQDSLYTLLEELVNRLLDNNIQNVDNQHNQHLSKALNVAMVKVLENSNRNATYSALILILERATVDLRDLSSSEASDRIKFTELIMKCLW
ncbi:510_t:CDS:2, partial [Ambispora leptoticha]